MGSMMVIMKGLDRVFDGFAVSGFWGFGCVCVRLAFKGFGQKGAQRCWRAAVVV